MPYLRVPALVNDVMSTTRKSQLFTIRADTLNTQGIVHRPDENTIAAVWNYLKTQTTVTFPSTAIIEGWWWLPGEDCLCVQANDSSFLALAANDVMINNVL